MPWLRVAAFSAALGISALFAGAACDRASAQSLELVRMAPDAPGPYRETNRAAEEPAPGEDDAAASGAATGDTAEAPREPEPVDSGARVRDELLAGLLGYGVAAGLGVLFGLVDDLGEDVMLVSIGLLAPGAIALGTWIGGVANGGSRFDGAMIGTTIGALLAAGLVLAFGRPTLEDAGTITIAILAPVIGATAGAEIATALSGARF